ncbi:HAD-IIB family hydrolase [Microbacterium sp. cx-55]|uniref:HAD family hydrolase n=1 Tax=unclassified Microbacterium TaxID=2609290 RepID=UPI001CBDD777|nr:MULTISPECIES: HAD-IIB family hydrolase [unclassified Microbacterium]MCC4909242.1 HAD-IIB family hydrolase [Microbacterium sp. cx-59]UGB34846.1 HAD-IIB family hydrolase [Microbacterium sp. cx-55]
MNDASLPARGEVDVEPVSEAAELVEGLAKDAASGAETMLIVLDIDGTVLLEDESTSPGIVEAIADARRAGHDVMLATGRSWEATHRLHDVLEIAPDYAVCSNGAVIMKRTGDPDAGAAAYERFHTETFDAREVLTLLREHLPDAHYLVELPDGRRQYTDYMDDWNLDRAEQVEFEELSRVPVTRVVVVSPEQTERDFVELVERVGLNQVSYAVGWTAWLDIAPKGVDKGTALAHVSEWTGIDAARVLVMGDGRNDVGMFAWARENGGRAVAMGQGPQEVRDAAGEVTASVSEGGVAAVLREL